MMNRKINLVGAIALLVTLLTGCGLKGPLYQTPPTAPDAQTQDTKPENNNEE